MDRIVDKVRKMLALAENEAASEGERDNALRMAWALIRKHNLDPDEIKNSGSQEEAREDVWDEFYGRPWAVKLCMAIADLFFCIHYYTPSKKNMARHHFVGKQSNSTTARLISMFLISSIRKESSKQARALGEGATWRRSFCLGAVSSLRKRINEILDQERPTTGTDLVVIVKQQEEASNRDYLGSIGVKLHKVAIRSSRTTNWDAMVQGVGFGDKLPLNTQVDLDDGPKLLR